MMNYLLLVLAVLLSYAFVMWVKPKKEAGLRLLLSFSGAFLLALTLIELFPAVYANGNAKTIGAFVCLGILLQIVLEFFSKGAEHGHMHFDAKKTHFPLVLFLSLSIHALLEGLPIDHHPTLLYGILVHKIPIAIILSIFLVNSLIKKSWTFLFIFLFSIMTPLGMLVGKNLALLENYYVPITSLIIGILLHISTVILFESTEGHTFNLQKLLAIAVGFAMAFLLLVVLS